MGLPIALHIASTLTIGDLLVGMGTLALAGVTTWLGFETRASARAAREAVEASEEPFVIATPTDDIGAMVLRRGEFSMGGGARPPFEIHRVQEPDGSGAFVRLKLWNIGSGPAIVQNVHMGRKSGDEYLDNLERFYPVGALMAADVEIRSPRWPTRSGVAELVITYTRASGITYRTRQAVTIDGSLVHGVTYTRERMERPLTTAVAVEAKE